MPVAYEWDVETQVTYDDRNDIDSMDVLDHQHVNSYKEAKLVAAGTPEPHEEGTVTHHIVLVRDDDEGRAWAYLEDGVLPEFFMDADGKNTTRVPKRFHEEVARAV